MSKSIQNEEVANEVKPAKITSLADLQAMLNNPIKVKLTVADKQIELECRRLTPKELADIDAIEQEVLPPMVRHPGDDRTKDYFDTADAQYRKNRAQKSREARAIAIYLGCPLFSQQKPGLKNRAEILEFVESCLTEALLMVIYEAIVQSEANLDAHVSFT